jgi:hypothetical protein
MKIAGKFVGVLFLSRTVAHQLHLKTTSYAEHKALQEFYEGIVELADGFAEQYQGAYAKLLDIPFLAAKELTEPVKYFEETLKWIEDNRYDVCEKSETALQNAIDEVVALFQSTLYKLRFLK